MRCGGRCTAALVACSPHAAADRHQALFAALEPVHPESLQTDDSARLYALCARFPAYGVRSPQNQWFCALSGVQSLFLVVWRENPRPSAVCDSQGVLGAFSVDSHATTPESRF